MEHYRNRMEAGALLAKEVARRVKIPNPIVLGLSRGGVPVAFPIAKALNAQFDVLVVRKLGVPSQPELAFGAIAPDGVLVFNQDVIDAWRVSDDEVTLVEQRERAELERREQLYRQGLPRLDVKNRAVILVDDGLATGATMQAALEWAKKRGALVRIVAVPVASRTMCEELSQNHACNLCVCKFTPEPFYAVGMWYHDFSQTSDEDVISLINRGQVEAGIAHGQN